MPSFGPKFAIGRGLFCWLLVGLILFGGTGCSAEQIPGVLVPAETPVLKAERRGGQFKEVSPPVAIQQLRQKLEQYQPQVKILSPKAGELLNENQVSIRLQVRDLPIYKDPKFQMGPHLQIFVDDRPGQRVYDLNEPLIINDLQPGSHSLRVFAARPWDESFKNEGAYAQSTFHVFTKTLGNVPSPEQPLVTYSSPQGDYGAEPLLLDFYLYNAPLHFIAQDDPKDDITDWRLRATIDGESFTLDRWQPIYLKGFKPGQNWLKLEFLDEDGNAVEDGFNTSVRLVNYKPGSNDTLAQLVQGKLTAEAAMGIVDPAFVNKVPELEPKPEPESKSKPESKLEPKAIAPKTELPKPATVDATAEPNQPPTAPGVSKQADKQSQSSQPKPDVEPDSSTTIPATPAKPNLTVPVVPVPAKKTSETQPQETKSQKTELQIPEPKGSKSEKAKPQESETQASETKSGKTQASETQASKSKTDEAKAVSGAKATKQPFWKRFQIKRESTPESATPAPATARQTKTVGVPAKPVEKTIPEQLEASEAKPLELKGSETAAPEVETPPSKKTAPVVPAMPESNEPKPTESRPIEPKPAPPEESKKEVKPFWKRFGQRKTAIVTPPSEPIRDIPGDLSAPAPKAAIPALVPSEMQQDQSVPETARLEAASAAQRAAEAEKAKAEKAEAERIKAEEAEAERIKAEKAKAEAERIKAEKAKAEAERIKAEKARAEAERIKAEKAKAEAERVKVEKAEAERIKAEKKAKAEAERVKAEKAKAEAERIKAEKAKAEAERIKAEKAKAEAERVKAEKAEAERIKTEKAKAEAERIRAEKAKAEAERVKAEKAEAERVKAEKAKAEAERIKAEKAKAERAKAEKARAEKTAADSVNDEIAPPTTPVPAADKPTEKPKNKPFWQRSLKEKSSVPSLFEREIQGTDILIKGSDLEESAKAVTAPKPAPPKTAPKPVTAKPALEPAKATESKTGKPEATAQTKRETQSKPETDASTQPRKSKPFWQRGRSKEKPAQPSSSQATSTKGLATEAKTETAKANTPEVEKIKAKVNKTGGAVQTTETPKAESKAKPAPVKKEPSLFEREILSKSEPADESKPQKPIEKQPFWRAIAPPPIPQTEPLGEPQPKPKTKSAAATPKAARPDSAKAPGAATTPEKSNESKDFDKAFQRFEQEIEQAEKSTAAKESAADIFGSQSRKPEKADAPF